MSTYPDVPKKIQSRIRAVYLKVFDARDKIAYIEAKIRDYQIELDEFHAEPFTYAELRYPSSSNPDSYPVVTHTGRLQEWLDRKWTKFASYFLDLEAAEFLMNSVEQEVLEHIAKMKPNTPGRVPWPEKPRTLQMLRKEQEKIFAKERKKSAAHRLKSRHQHQIRQKKFEENQALVSANIKADIARRAQLMPPKKAAIYLSLMEIIQEKLFDDGLTVYDLASGNGTATPAMEEIMAEAEVRASARSGLANI